MGSVDITPPFLDPPKGWNERPYGWDYMRNTITIHKHVGTWDFVSNHINNETFIVGCLRIKPDIYILAMNRLKGICCLTDIPVDMWSRRNYAIKQMRIFGQENIEIHPDPNDDTPTVFLVINDDDTYKVSFTRPYI